MPWLRRFGLLVAVDVAMGLVLAAYVGPTIVHGLGRSWGALRYEVGDGPPGATGRPDRLVVMTWNLARLRGPGYPAPGLSEAGMRDLLGAVVETVAQVGPDVLLLQECDRGSQDSFGIEVDREIAERAFGDAAVVYGPNYDARVGIWSWNSGNAIVTRLAVTAAELRPFEGYLSIRRRFVGAKSLLSATLAAPVPGGRLDVHDVHLYAYDAGQRDRELREVAGAIEPDVASIVAGDFNLDPSTASSWLPRHGPDGFAPLEAHGLIRVPPDSSVRTFHAERPDRTIDYVFAPVAPVEWRVLPTGASDHRPVVAVYSLEEPGWGAIGE